MSTGRAGGTLRGGSRGASDFPREHRLQRGGAGLIPKRPRPTLSDGYGRRAAHRYAPTAGGTKGRGSDQALRGLRAEGTVGKVAGLLTRSLPPPANRPLRLCLALSLAETVSAVGVRGLRCVGRVFLAVSGCRDTARVAATLRPSPPSLLKAVQCQRLCLLRWSHPALQRRLLTGPLASTLWKGGSPLEGVWTRALRGGWGGQAEGTVGKAVSPSYSNFPEPRACHPVTGGRSLPRAAGWWTAAWKAAPWSTLGDSSACWTLNLPLPQAPLSRSSWGPQGGNLCVGLCCLRPPW